MKLLVKKNNGEFEIKSQIDGVINDFDYVELINYLYTNNKLEDTEYDENISEWEKNSINDLIQKINNTIKGKEETDAKIDDFLNAFDPFQ